MRAPPPSDAAGDEQMVVKVSGHLWLPERERVCLGAGLEEGDFHSPLADSLVLAHELVHAGGPEHAIPILVDVDAVSEARSLSVEAHAERNRLACPRREHEMGVARVEAVDNAPAGLVE